ncbi:MAG: DUF4082 domain-containing protein [Ruminococcaceae bacterium]|nr:DUF4082 domain-containing protein [Oscillospiraceae bacterium]
MKMHKWIAIFTAALMLCSLLPLSAVSVVAADTYLGCETTGSEQWNITTDYVYAAFTPGANKIDAIKAYLRVRAGESTITVAVCTDVYGKGEVLAEASQSFNPGGSTNVWAEFVFDAPVDVVAGQTYYVRIGSVGSPKITLYGYATTSTDEYRAYVDNGRSGSGWRTNYLPNFVVSEVESKLYLGCTELGAENWNIQGDYIWAPFATAADHITAIKAYVRVQPGVGTLTAAIYTDYYGKGELVAAATLNCNYESATKGWQTLTFDQPVAVNPGQVYYIRFGSDNVKVTLWGKDSATANDPWREFVDAGRVGSGWSNNRLVNFEVVEMKTYLGCTELGAENWNIQNDYLWAPFSTADSYVESVKAYVRVQPGSGTLTAALCTDYFGKGEVLGTATLNCNYSSATKGWQTLTFDLPVKVKPGQVYYIRLGSDNVKVTLWGKDSATANDPWREFVDVGRAGTGWTNNRLVNMEVVTTTLNDIITGEGKSISEDVNGLAFKFNIDAANIGIKNGHLVVLDDATAAPFANAKGYTLTRLGAIASNDPSAELTMDNLSDHTKDVEIKNVFALYEDSMDFTVRIINIPDANKDTIITVRPYYVLSNGESSIIIYGDAVSGSYNAALS